jgi:SAM-dependent methyltransferase
LTSAGAAAKSASVLALAKGKAPVAELVDAADSKSVAFTGVLVRVRPGAPKHQDGPSLTVGSLDPARPGAVQICVNTGTHVNQAATAQRYPVPPEELRWRAIGSRDPEAFLASSNAGVDFFDKEALARQRKSLKDFSSILDFGCGCGRLIRSLRPLCDQWASLYGTDVDAAAIAWCRDNITDASFSMNGENPPLRFEDKSMDLIYACSVFTHLDAQDQFRWLAELQRIMKPDGYLLLTFRYRYNIDQLADPAIRDRIWEELDREGIAFLPADLSKGAAANAAGEAYHTPEYIRKNWGRYFEVCDIITAGTIAQDTAVLRARESSFLQRLFRTP